MKEDYSLSIRQKYKIAAMQYYSDITFESAKDLVRYCARIADAMIEDDDLHADNSEMPDSERKNKILYSKSVETLELSSRSANLLRNMNIQTIGKLAKMTKNEISKKRNIGKKSVDEIELKLKGIGLSFAPNDYQSLKENAKSIDASDNK